MKIALSALCSGLLFGAGLAISGMTNTTRVQNFLDVFGAWDPTLAFVMGSGLVVATLGYQWVFRSPKPRLAAQFSLPARSDIDARLLTGAVIFGVGWGLVGYCPGPALAGLSYGHLQTLVFVPAMIIGLLLAQWSHVDTKPGALRST